ncbi:MAG: hypothetical protein U0166_21885 [Acidobacteriota bacterium]
MTRHSHATLAIAATIVLGAFHAAALAESAAGHVTRGKLASDLGDYAGASTHFAAAADDDTAPARVRWEALVRLGLVRQALADRAGASAAYARLLSDFGTDPAARRYLIESVTGLSIPDAIWPGLASIPVTVAPAPAGPLVAVTWPDANGSACRAPGPPATVSLDFKDAELPDVFHFLGDFTGIPFVADRCLDGLTVTLRRSDVPWDEALATIVGAYGLSCRYAEGQGFAIGCGSSTPAGAAAPATARRQSRVDDLPAANGVAISEIEIQGVMVLPGGARYAIATDPAGNGHRLEIGDRLSDGSVKAIENDRVVFSDARGDDVVKRFASTR